MAKFRVWCKNRNEWETDYVFLRDDGEIFQSTCFGDNIISIREDTHIVQFQIGQRDILSKEIYAGDIGKDSFGNKWEVVWDELGCCWGVNSLSDTGNHSECYPMHISFAWIQLHQFIVTGNIFEGERR